MAEIAEEEKKKKIAEEEEKEKEKKIAEEEEKEESESSDKEKEKSGDEEKVEESEAEEDEEKVGGNEARVEAEIIVASVLSEINEAPVEFETPTTPPRRGNQSDGTPTPPPREIYTTPPRGRTIAMAARLTLQKCRPPPVDLNKNLVEEEGFGGNDVQEEVGGKEAEINEAPVESEKKEEVAAIEEYTEEKKNKVGCRLLSRRGRRRGRSLKKRLKSLCMELPYVFRWFI